MDLERLVAANAQLSRYFRDGSYDFSTTESQCLAAEAYLRTCLGLKVNLDRTKLCPRIPNRLSYLEWCEAGAQAIDHFKRSSLVVDIGTGSSAIYPLLGASIYKELSFVGTEIDPDSVTLARKIVSDNELKTKISIQQHPGDEPRPKFPRSKEAIRYTLCNPPFYSNENELSKRSAFKAPKPNELSSSRSEMFYEGGETAFIEHLVQDSIVLSAECPEATERCWFLSQIGIRGDCPKVEAILTKRRKAGEITQFRIDKLRTENSTTSRWVVAWAVHWWRWPGGRNVFTTKVNVEEIHRRLGARLQPQLRALEDLLSGEFTMDLAAGRLVVRTTVPVWTRKVRRTLSRGERIVPGVCQIFLVEHTRVTWVHGDDFQVFYSFLRLVAELTQTADVRHVSK